jgi:hypothetical protein
MLFLTAVVLPFLFMYWRLRRDDGHQNCLTLAAYLLPAGLGDASLANLPPQAGLSGRSSTLQRTHLILMCAV